MLELEKVNNHYNKEIIQIISLDIDPRETIEMVQDYIHEFQTDERAGQVIYLPIIMKNH